MTFQEFIKHNFRSKTCPQCRNKCSQKNIFKVYFNQANLDTSKIDVGSLQEQLDNANLKIKMKELETNKATKEIAGLKEIQKKCIKTITALEEKVASNNHVVSTYAQQMQVLKSEIKVVESLRSENKALKTKLQLLDTVNDMITANQDETERLLRECKEIRPLGICITSLKKELRNADSKKTELRNMVKALQNEVRKGTEVKKMLEDRISTLESENFHLKEKVSVSFFINQLICLCMINIVCEGNCKMVFRKGKLLPVIQENFIRICNIIKHNFSINSTGF